MAAPRPLVLIGYSADEVTRQAFEDEGCEVYTCDLLPSRGGDQSKHLRCDVWDAIRSRPWAFGLFHPMCTYLTVSAAWALKDPDFEKYPGVGYHQRIDPGKLYGAPRREQQQRDLENFAALLALDFPAVLENPALNFVNRVIASPWQVVHPHEFGSDASKATGLWRNDVARRARLPTLLPTERVPPRWVQGKKAMLPRWANQTDSGQNRLSPGEDRWLQRSETYPGIAKAMGATWGAWLVARAAQQAEGATHG